MEAVSVILVLLFVGVVSYVGIKYLKGKPKGNAPKSAPSDKGPQKDSDGTYR